MRDLTKKFSSLIIAIVIVFVILFLPDANLQFITNSIEYIGRNDAAGMTIGNFLLNGTVKGLAILIATAIFSYLAHWVYQRGLKD